MSYIEDFFHILISPGHGLIFSRIALDLALFLPLNFVVYHYLSVFYKSWKRIKVLDRIAGLHIISSQYSLPHWLEGHRRHFTHDHEGLMRTVERTATFPALFNFHLAPWLSSLNLTHPDAIAPLVAGSAPKCGWCYRFLKPWIGNGLLRSNGDYWQRHRRLITPAFHFSILKSYIPTFNDCAKEMLHKLDSTKGKPVEVFEPVGLLTLDTMLRCAMSTTTNCQATNHRHPYVEAIHVLSDVISIRGRTPILYFDWIFNLLPIGRRFQKALDAAHSCTAKIITDRRRELMKSSTDHTHEEMLNYRGGKLLNFLDTLLTAEDENGAKLCDKEVCEEVDTFLFEGHDTTSSGISWTLFNLATFPVYQAKCRSEINEVLGSKVNVEWADLPKLEYLTMCIKESLRLYPPVPMVMRDLDRSLPIKSRYNVSGEAAPKGSSVVMHIMSLHRNRHLWEKPDEFVPERFSKENLQKATHNSFLRFSAGSRNCIGQNFAMNEMKVVLALTLRRFKLSIDPSTPETRMSYGLVLRSENGIHIKFENYMKNSGTEM